VNHPDTPPGGTNQPEPPYPALLLAVDQHGQVAAAFDTTDPGAQAAVKKYLAALAPFAADHARYLVADVTADATTFWQAVLELGLGRDTAGLPVRLGPARRAALTTLAPAMRCAGCGCTDNDACLSADGQACSWTAPRWCSSCAEIEVATAEDGPRPARLADIGIPPEHLDGDPEEAHRWLCQYALTTQAAIIEHQDDVVFHGFRAGATSLVDICAGTACTAVVDLANTGHRYSPGGFSWGGNGASPAALARSLITAALGTRARCETCDGSGWTVWDGTLKRHRPTRPGDGTLNTSSCDSCDNDGIAIPPAVIQAYKTAVPGRMQPRDEWWISRGDVLAWLAEQHIDPGLAAYAAGAVTR
jgi:hypothetical protein